MAKTGRDVWNRRESNTDLLGSLVDEFREDDGVRPGRKSRSEHASGSSIADLRLGGQIRDALVLALAESGDPVISSLRIDAVSRVGRGSTFAVRLVPEEGAPPIEREEAQSRISDMSSYLRMEVSRAITRKLSPHLRFEVVPQGGWEVTQADDESISEHEILEEISDIPVVEPIRNPFENIEAHSAETEPELVAERITSSGRQVIGGETPLVVWSPERKLPRDVDDALRNIHSSPDVRYVAVMPDIHLGKQIPNGVVLATRQLIYPEAIGADIGCGVLAMRFDLDSSIFEHKLLAMEVLRCIANSVPVLKRTRHHQEISMPAELVSNELSTSYLEKEKMRDGLRQLGTLGRGNHFIELQSDSVGGIWLMIHTGSRGMGQAVFSGHTREAKQTESGLLYLDAATESGQAFFNDVRWATNYAAANRLAIASACELVIQNITGHGADPLSKINVPHNFLRAEEHFGEHLLVHRKSALSAAKDEVGLIPGSMAGPSFHVLGRGSPDSLGSCAHGAGRRMSRTEARQEISPAEFRRQMGKIVFNSSAEDALVDEAPGAYKNPREVMRAQKDLAKRIRELTPILNYKVP